MLLIGFASAATCNFGIVGNVENIHTCVVKCLSRKNEEKNRVMLSLIFRLDSFSVIGRFIACYLCFATACCLLLATLS